LDPCLLRREDFLVPQATLYHVTSAGACRCPANLIQLSLTQEVRAHLLTTLFFHVSSYHVGILLEVSQLS